MKTVFMGSPEISVPFLDFCLKKGDEVIVFSQKDKIRGRGKKLEPTPVKKRALELGLPVYTCSAKSDKAFEIISDFKPDLLFVVAYGQILPKRLLDAPRLYPVNVHFSLLPKYRGATPVNTALLNGDRISGTTVMVMGEELDSGDILLSSECEVSPDDNATTLFEKLTSISLRILDESWEKLASGTLKATPQAGEPVFTKMIGKDDMWVDFSDEAEKVFNKIRALTLEPGIRSVFRENIVSIEKAELVSDCSGRPGEVLEVSKNGIKVACGAGGILIKRLKPAGKKGMSVAEFLNGNKVQTGEFFTGRE